MKKTFRITGEPCPLCGGGPLKESRKAVEEEIGGKKCLLPAVPHDYCPDCNEHFYGAGTLSNFGERKKKPARKTA